MTSYMKCYECEEEVPLTDGQVIRMPLDLVCEPCKLLRAVLLRLNPHVLEAVVSVRGGTLTIADKHRAMIDKARLAISDYDQEVMARLNRPGGSHE